MDQPHAGLRGLDRSRLYDFALVLVGVVALVLKGRAPGRLIHSYGGNVAASFSTFFLLKLPFVPARFRVATAVALALLATELFEATDGGFGTMSNTYDPVDYAANAIGVAVAVVVNAVVRTASRSRQDA